MRLGQPVPARVVARRWEPEPGLFPWEGPGREGQSEGRGTEAPRGRLSWPRGRRGRHEGARPPRAPVSHSPHFPRFLPGDSLGAAATRKDWGRRAGARPEDQRVWVCDEVTPLPAPRPAARGPRPLPLTLSTSRLHIRAAAQLVKLPPRGPRAGPSRQRDRRPLLGRRNRPTELGAGKQERPLCTVAGRSRGPTVGSH